jgi:hypothetical protein
MKRFGLQKRASKFTLKISQNQIIFDKFVHNSLVSWTREHLLKGKAQYGSLLVLTSLDQLIATLKLFLSLSENKPPS